MERGVMHWMGGEGSNGSPAVVGPPKPPSKWGQVGRGAEKCIFLYNRSCLGGREQGKLDSFTWASSPREEPPWQKGLWRRRASREVAPDQAVSGVHACRRAVFDSGVGFSGVIEGCLPIIWCENDSQMLEGNLLNIPKCTTRNRRRKQNKCESNQSTSSLLPLQWSAKLALIKFWQDLLSWVPGEAGIGQILSSLYFLFALR